MSGGTIGENELKSTKETSKGKEKKTVLVIVYYFPPMGSSGVQRPLKLIKYIKEFGWEPIVLAPEPGLYTFFDESLEAEIEAIAPVIYRVKANTPFDKVPGKKSGIGMMPERVQDFLRYLSSFIYIPDNKKGWISPALEKALEIIQKHNIDLVYSTAPPYSNHLIANEIKTKTSIPVVLDFRDDWTGSHLIRFPTRWHYRKSLALEKTCLSNADLVTAINGQMLQDLKGRNPESKGRFEVLPQGYDPEEVSVSGQTYDSGTVSLLYNGLFYGENQPYVFFEAVCLMLERKPEWKSTLRLVFQGGLQEAHHLAAEKSGVFGLIDDCGYLSHKEALDGLKNAGVLWFTVGHKKSAGQVTTSKVYEYIGTGKPVFGLVPSGGEAANLLREYGAGYAASPDDAVAASHVLERLIGDFIEGKTPAANIDLIRRHDRRRIAGEAAKLFDDVIRSDNHQKKR